MPNRDIPSRTVAASPVRILFADDDRLVLATIARGLGDAGYTIRTADSGETALSIAAAESFDLALLDIRMTGISGIDTARQLREKHGIRTMFLSAYSERELVKEAVANGGLGYLVKPVDVIHLVPAIEAALARASDLKALEAAREQLEHALAGGRHASMAVGIFMERRGLGEQAAFDALRTGARKSRRKLEDYCSDVVKTLERLNGM